MVASTIDNFFRIAGDFTGIMGIELGTGWPTVYLGDVVKIQTGKSNKEDAVPDGNYAFFDRSRETQRSNRFLFDTEAVIVPGEGSEFYPKYYDGPFDLHQRVYAITDFDGVDGMFLYYVLWCKRKYFSQVAIGSTVKSLRKGMFERFSFDCPPMNTQRDISSILSTYDRLIQNNLRRISLLIVATEVLYKEWFVKFRFPGHQRANVVNGVPRGWERKRIGEIAPFRYGRSLKSDNRVPGEFPVYGSSGVVGTHQEPLVAGPAIIVGRKGNVGSVFWSQRGFYPIDTVYYIESSDSSLFLYHALRYTQFINTDVAVPGLNRKFAHSKAILIPDRALIDIFEQYATANYQQVDHLTKCNNALAKTRDLLLPCLISGRIPV